MGEAVDVAPIGKVLPGITTPDEVGSPLCGVGGDGASGVEERDEDEEDDEEPVSGTPSCLSTRASSGCKGGDDMMDIGGGEAGTDADAGGLATANRSLTGDEVLTDEDPLAAPASTTDEAAAVATAVGRCSRLSGTGTSAGPCVGKSGVAGPGNEGDADMVEKVMADGDASGLTAGDLGEESTSMVMRLDPEV